MAVEEYLEKDTSREDLFEAEEHYYHFPCGQCKHRSELISFCKKCRHCVL